MRTGRPQNRRPCLSEIQRDQIARFSRPPTPLPTPRRRPGFWWWMQIAWIIVLVVGGIVAMLAARMKP